MTSIKESFSLGRKQYLVFIAMSAVAFGLTAIINFSDPHIFKRFIGEINPFIPAIVLGSLGVVLLVYLLSRGWFIIYKKENIKGLIWRSVLAALLASITILIDLKIVFPADMNIVFPMSLLFYPAIGFFAEILFHVLPLSMFLLILTSVFRTASQKDIIWICIVVVSLLEPIYQTASMIASNHYPVWAVTYLGFHLFLFNFIQMLIFKRYGFVSMYLFRMVYYLIWHVVWGHLRLKLLF